MNHGVLRGSCCPSGIVFLTAMHIDPSKNRSGLYSDIANTIYWMFGPCQWINSSKGYTPGGTLLLIANSIITHFAEYLKRGTSGVRNRSSRFSLHHEKFPRADYEVNNNRIFNPDLTTTLKSQPNLDTPLGTPPLQTPLVTESIILSPNRLWGLGLPRLILRLTTGLNVLRI